MSKTTTITCDRCGGEFGPNTRPWETLERHVPWDLLKLTQGPGADYKPSLDFCSMRCLATWATEWVLRQQRHEENLAAFRDGSERVPGMWVQEPHVWNADAPPLAELVAR